MLRIAQPVSSTSSSPSPSVSCSTSVSDASVWCRVVGQWAFLATPEERASRVMRVGGHHHVFLVMARGCDQLVEALHRSHFRKAAVYHTTTGRARDLLSARVNTNLRSSRSVDMTHPPKCAPTVVAMLYPELLATALWTGCVVLVVWEGWKHDVAQSRPVFDGEGRGDRQRRPRPAAAASEVILRRLPVIGCD